MAFLQKLLAGPAAPPANVFEETARNDVTCWCGCGRRWVRSHGRLRIDGQVSSFVVLPESHGAEKVAWMAISDGPEPSTWTFIRTGLAGENVAAGLVDANQSPLGGVVSPVRTAAAARANQDLKVRVFGVHDQLVARHPDVRQLMIDGPDGRGRDHTFKMPDCVYAQPAAERSPRNQQNFAECGDRLFVRALLPVSISDGTEFRLGVWLELSEDAFFHVMKVWNDEPAYLATRVQGVVESSVLINGRDLRGEKLELAPRSASECLFVKSSQSGWVSELMREGLSIRDLPAFVEGIERSMKQRARA